MLERKKGNVIKRGRDGVSGREMSGYTCQFYNYTHVL